MNWIWLKNKTENNAFVEFEQTFAYQKGNVQLRVSADYKYFAYLGNVMVSCGQYADLPTYKSVNGADLTPFVSKGENVLRIVAWHMGMDCSVCRAMMPSVAFEVLIDGKVVAESSEQTRCRQHANYLPSELITRQLGYGFNYDFTACKKEWQNAVVVQTNFVEIDRPIKQTTVGELCISTAVMQGVFLYRKEYENSTVAKQMQNAWLTPLRFAEMTGKNRVGNDSLAQPITFKAKSGNGVFVIFDMGRETCGHLAFTVTVNKPCKMILGWGEHLADGRCRTEIDGRNFALQFNLKAGENVLDDYLLRIGCRYICIFVENDSVTVARMGIREVGYPFTFLKKDFGDKLHNSIYETGRRTLYLSAHEHYEDCPWREQALYGMDSRNQMLFGYGAFGEYDYPRANLMLIAKCLQSNGLIPLTAPAEMTITIPSFTAYWLIAIGENAEVDYNEQFVKDILPYAEKSLNTLLKQEGDCGLSLFTDIAFWNFHEWSDRLDGGEIFRSEPIEPQFDANLTALTVVAINKMAYLYEKLGNFDKATELQNVAKRLGESLECFYDHERGLYASYIKDGRKFGYHELTQSAVLFAHCVPQNRLENLCNVLKRPTDYQLVPITFSALQLKYQALMENGDNADFVLRDMENVFGKMLCEGATSYWETEIGEADFDDAGSLCHGWSAVCCWVLDKMFH